MEPFAYTALGALGGVLVTALVAMWTARRTHEREVVAAAIQAATVDFQANIERIKLQRGGDWMPLHFYIHWHTGIARLAVRGKLTDSAIAKLRRENARIYNETKNHPVPF